MHDIFVKLLRCWILENIAIEASRHLQAKQLYMSQSIPSGPLCCVIRPAQGHIRRGRALRSNGIVEDFQEHRAVALVLGILFVYPPERKPSKVQYSSLVFRPHAKACITTPLSSLSSRAEARQQKTNCGLPHQSLVQAPENTWLRLENLHNTVDHLSASHITLETPVP